MLHGIPQSSPQSIAVSTTSRVPPSYECLPKYILLSVKFFLILDHQFQTLSIHTEHSSLYTLYKPQKRFQTLYSILLLDFAAGTSTALIFTALGCYKEKLLKHFHAISIPVASTLPHQTNTNFHQPTKLTQHTQPTTSSPHTIHFSALSITHRIQNETAPTLYSQHNLYFATDIEAKVSLLQRALPYAKDFDCCDWCVP